MVKPQIWDTEESKWKCRNIERKEFIKLALEQDGRFLEIGPGYGRVLNLVKLAGKEIVGLELSLELTEQLINKGFNVLQGDITSIPFSDNSFDCVLLEEVFEHINQQSKALTEIYRVLKPSGVVVLCTPNKWIYRFFMYASNLINLKFAWSLIKNPTPGHIAECTIHKLKQLMKQFYIEKIVPINPYVSSSLLMKYPHLAIDIIVVARKK